MASGNGSNGKKNLVVIQLSGGNDYLNTVIPYEEGLYYDFRPTVRIERDDVLPVENGLGFNSHMGPMKRLWDEGKLAVINGIGYPNPNRSHFRSMDIWHTAEARRHRHRGVAGKGHQGVGPVGENVLTGVNFGRGLPRALGVRGVPVASVGNLETYGLFPDIEDEELRKYALEAFAKMYGGERGKNAVMDFLGQTGTDALKGADILRTAPEKYSSDVEYAADPMAQSMKSVAQVMFADLGTQIYYTQHGSFDTHSGSLPRMPSSGTRYRARSATSTTTSRGTVGRTTPSSSSSRSSAGASRTTALGPTTARAAPPSSLAATSRAGMYGEYPSLKEETARGRPPLQQRLPVYLLDHTGAWTPSWRPRPSSTAPSSRSTSSRRDQPL